MPGSHLMDWISVTFQGQKMTESATLVSAGQNFIMSFNSLPNDKILDWSNFKAFADNEIKVT